LKYHLRGVEKIYGTRTVLRIPALDIQPGEILAVVGPSGAGKSTLLRLLHFLEPPTLGEVAYSQNSRSEPEELSRGWPVPLAVRRRVAMLFQRPEMIAASVRENVALGLRFRGAYDEKTVEDALNRVDLAPLGHAPARTLSGGELQRAALARLLALTPSVYLLDEPTANLDPGNVAVVEEAIRGMRAAGAAVVLVTHNVFQARRLADRVAFILGGSLIECNPAEKFFDTPDDPRSRAFVRGEMVY